MVLCAKQTFSIIFTVSFFFSRKNNACFNRHVNIFPIQVHFGQEHSLDTGWVKIQNEGLLVSQTSIHLFLRD